MRSLIAAAVMALAFGVPARAAPPLLQPLDWLVGHWIGEGGRTGMAGAGGFSFQPDVEAHVLVRRNVSDYPPKAGKPGQHHQDLMVIYAEGQALKASYWDNEGQVIRYTVQAGPDAVVFVSEDAPGPRFRLSYRPAGAGLEGRFEVAPPNDPGHFTSYLAWTAHRVR